MNQVQQMQSRFGGAVSSSRGIASPLDDSYPSSQRRQPKDPEADGYDDENNNSTPEDEVSDRAARSGGDENATPEDAVLDLAELEQLQEEAERMKGLGNKHMAAQEYTRAYNAYSAALQLSPVGPSSHVFLSNRAASLLSLKRYSAAAVDARRAVALAPTFGKAHARLGQALYFLKQYKGAVEAYEDALKFEEEDGNGGNSAVTRAYLQKAREKLAKQEEKERRKQLAATSPDGDESTMAGEESVNPTVAYSVATDNNKHGVAGGMRTSSARVNAVAIGDTANGMSLQQMAIKEDEDPNKSSPGMESPYQSFHVPDTQQSSPAMMTVKTGPMGGPAQQKLQEDAAAPAYSEPVDDSDPDFDEALRLQRRATHFLTHKQYRIAVDEFSSALFLVPDDPILTPQLHVGRAHALNGQERFESAKNDALMALKHILRDRDEDISAAEAYSVLGKSLYYSNDYQGSVEALQECDRIWKENGGNLSVFDQAYLDQCREALDAGLGAVDQDDKSVMSHHTLKSVVSHVKDGTSISNIPKLKPPRFVSREKALQIVPNLPPPPKDWPLQSPTSPTCVSTGPERTVTFLSSAMGIKLNRGTDGLIRVISVAKLPPGSPILRSGEINTGDLVREAGGVDLRRPITATMWGDTVALIKMAPRPLIIIVAKQVGTTPGFKSDDITPAVRAATVVFGPERTVTFLSDASMGITLNRGVDGVVRVINVANLPPGSREGEINIGDVVLDAGGFDLRRPVSAAMWGEMMASVKVAPRPLQFIVAKEMSSELETPSSSAEI